MNASVRDLRKVKRLIIDQKTMMIKDKTIINIVINNNIINSIIINIDDIGYYYRAVLGIIQSRST